ncbi:hypothetical protein MP638_007442 [Amoeboaphelidium occidentale]|nr:hypothetical protein MP638_007442 [Amoeboaphelidium occidentale]
MDDYFQCCPEEDCDFVARGQGAKKKVRLHFSRVHKNKTIPNDLLLHSENAMECPFEGCTVKMCGLNKIANLRNHYETVHAGHELPQILRRVRPQKSTADVDPLERLWKGCVPVPEAKLKKIPVLSRKVRLSQEEDEDDDKNSDIETAILERKPRRGVLGLGALVTKSASDKENGVKSSSSSSSEISFEDDENESDSSDNSVLVEFAKGGLPQAQWKQDLKSNSSEDDDEDTELKPAAPFQPESKVSETFFIEDTDEEQADSGASIVYSGSDADLAPYESEMEFFDSLFKDKTPKKRKNQNTKARKNGNSRKKKLSKDLDDMIPETPVVQTTTVIYLPDSPKETPKHEKPCYLSESSNTDEEQIEKKPLIQLNRRKLKRPNLKNFDGSFGDDSKHETDGLVQTKIGNFFSPVKPPSEEQSKRLSSRRDSLLGTDAPETPTKKLDTESSFKQQQNTSLTEAELQKEEIIPKIKAKSMSWRAYTKSNTTSNNVKVVGEISLLSDYEENFHENTTGSEIIVLSD